MKLALRTITICLLTLSLFSCATIFNGTNQDINISSNPSDAKVIIDEKEFGNTPLIAHLARKDNHIIKIKLEGYQEEIITLNRKNSNWFLGNCLFGGLIGMGIDAITGAMYILEPEEINTTLKVSEENTAMNDDTIIIRIVMKPNPKWTKIGQMKKIF